MSVKASSTSFKTCLYASNIQASSSEIIRAPGSAVSKTPSEAPSFSIFNKRSIAQENNARPRSGIREPVLPGVIVWLRPEWSPGSQDYWSDVLPKGSLLRMSNSG